MGIKKERTNINLWGPGGSIQYNTSPDVSKRNPKKKIKSKSKPRRDKDMESGHEKGQKQAPTFGNWLEKIGKGKFKTEEQARSAYQAEFGSIIPGAGIGGGGKAGAAGSGTGDGGKAGKAGSMTGKNQKASEQTAAAEKEQEKKKGKG